MDALRILRMLLLATSAMAQPGVEIIRADSIHYIRPGDDSQAVHDSAASSDKLVFLQGAASTDGAAS